MKQKIGAPLIFNTYRGEIAYRTAVGPRDSVIVLLRSITGILGSGGNIRPCTAAKSEGGKRKVDPYVFDE